MQKAGTEENQLAEMFPLFGHGIGLFWERPSLRIGLETGRNLPGEHDLRHRGIPVEGGSRRSGPTKTTSW